MIASDKISFTLWALDETSPLPAIKEGASPDRFRDRRKEFGVCTCGLPKRRVSHQKGGGPSKSWEVENKESVVAHRDVGRD